MCKQMCTFMYFCLVAAPIRGFLCGFIGVKLGDSQRRSHSWALINNARFGMHRICKRSPAIISHPRPNSTWASNLIHKKRAMSQTSMFDSCLQALLQSGGDALKWVICTCSVAAQLVPTSFYCFIFMQICGEVSWVCCLLPGEREETFFFFCLKCKNDQCRVLQTPVVWQY